MSLLTELSRRNVFRVAVAYLAAAWFVVQVAETLFPVFGLPDGAVRIVVIALAIGVVPAVILSWVFQWTPQGLKLDADAGSAALSASTKTLDRVIIVMLVLAVGYFAVDKFLVDPARDEAAVEAAREQGRSDAIVEAYGDQSIIVLPFVNMSDDREQEYFSDGLTEELLNLLARLPDLRVISRSTAFTFKDSKIALTDIANKVRVAHVLEGSVRRSGNTIRVTAQLIDARTDTHLWSETFDRTFDDVFAIQDDIAGRVVEELQLRLGGGSLSATRVDPRAYDLYLQAKHILNQVDSATTIQAEVLLETALEIEPDYVEAIAQLARAYHQRSQHQPGERAKYLAQRDELVSRLVAIAPDSRATNGWLGYLYLREANDLPAAARHIERAVAAEPTDLLTLRVAAGLYNVLGRHDEAIAIGRYVVERDPACGVCVSALAWSYREARRHREAARVLESILEWRPPDIHITWAIGVAWLVAGEPGRALPWFERSIDGPGKLGYIMALHDLGRTAEFEAEFAALRSNEDAGGYESAARIYAWIGDADSAFDYLDRAAAEDPYVIERIDTDLYDKIRSDPRWKALRSRHGVVDSPVESVAFDPPLPAEIRRSLEDERDAAASR